MILKNWKKESMIRLMNTLNTEEEKGCPLGQACSFPHYSKAEEEGAASCTVAHIHMLITDLQKMVVALERNSWKDTLRKNICMTWLRKKDGSSFFTLGVIYNFLLGDVGHV